MKHAVSRELHTYWNILRGGRTAPERGDVDPAAIRQILAYTFILDMAGGALPGFRQAAFRLSGTRLDALFGRDLRGTSFRRIWTGRDAAMVEAMLGGVTDDRIGAVASLRGGPPEAEPIDLELLLLPLRYQGHTHARMLGSLAPATTPGWMGLRAAAPLEMISFRGLRAGLPVPIEASGPPEQPGANATGLPAAPWPGRRGPFRIYQGGRGGNPADGIRW